MKHDLQHQGILSLESFTVQTVSELATALHSATKTKAKLQEYAKINRLTISQSKAKTKSCLVESVVVYSKRVASEILKEYLCIIDISEITGGQQDDSESVEITGAE